MKKTFDAVATMRKARQKLSEEWNGQPREQEIEFLSKKYAHLINKKNQTQD